MPEEENEGKIEIGSKEQETEEATDEGEKLSRKEKKAIASISKELEKAKKDLQEAKEALEKAKADSANWKNEYYRAYADTQNLRKSLEEDARVAYRYRSEGFLSSLLPALDAFHIALSNEPPSPETRNYLIGFSYIYNQLVKALTDEGVSEIAPSIGEEFDPSRMHAVETEEGDAPNKVVKVMAKGYKLHDRLIRPAMVVVSKAKAEEEDKAEEKPENPAQA